MICDLCNARMETRDCSDEELYYGICDTCLSKIKRLIKETPIVFNEDREVIVSTMNHMIMKDEPKTINLISTKKIYRKLIKAQELLLDNASKEEIIRLLAHVEQNIALLNDKDTLIDRDLFD